MTIRHDREDTTRQQARVATTRTDLAVALRALAAVASGAAKAAESKRGTPNLPAVYAAVTTVRTTEEALDLALLDLATARGEDA